MKSFNFPIFHLNSWKKGKILILEIQTSHKWWNMNSISRLIHVNFYHKTHHHTDNLNFYKQVSNWKFERRLLKFGFGHSIFVQELYYFHEDVTQRSTILTSAHKLPFSPKTKGPTKSVANSVKISKNYSHSFSARISWYQRIEY